MTLDIDHRTHGGLPYVKQVEGSGLGVGGPRVATLLPDLLRRPPPDARMRRFRFRARNEDGHRAMDATAARC